MHNENRFTWQYLLQYGVICAGGLLYVCLVGVVEAFDVRDVIDPILPLGQSLLIVISFLVGYMAAKNIGQGNPTHSIVSGLVAGATGGLALMIFVLLIEPWSIRSMFVNASPALIEILTLGQESQIMGLLMLVGLTTVTGILGAVVKILPKIPRDMVLMGLTAVLFMGMLQDFLVRIDPIEAFAAFIFGRKGLSVNGAIIIFVAFAVLHGLWAVQDGRLQRGFSNMPRTQQNAVNVVMFMIGFAFLLIIPQITDSYVTQILFLVGLYVLMGLGLNLELGWAGLLDLGFSGFFAIGAYTVALMSSTGELGWNYGLTGETGGAIGGPFSFWVSIPLAVALAAMAGVILGIPVLRTRGDYLAIITLGLAEIIRILLLSNAMKDNLGGAQGILNIDKPILAGIELKEPMHFYYLILIGCIVVGFMAWRLQYARIGRNWTALRDDEDVAEAMGINLVQTKLIAFGIGAAFAGLSGAVFAAQLGSVFPNSFGLLVSINVVSLVIIGGVGSIPGVIIGALVLVGLPELLREFAEFRLLIYGMLLVVMMLVKPEGFWPSEASRREMQSDDEIVPVT